MSREIDFSKRSLPNQFIERVVSNMTKVWREEFSSGGSGSDLNFRKRLGELTRGVLNKSWQAVGGCISSYLYSSWCSFHIARGSRRRTSVRTLFLCSCSSAFVFGAVMPQLCPSSRRCSRIHLTLRPHVEASKQILTGAVECRN
jgi:hypothetical protein